MPKCYELTARQWHTIEPLLPGKVGDPGRNGADNRLFVNAFSSTSLRIRTMRTSRSIPVWCARISRLQPARAQKGGPGSGAIPRWSDDQDTSRHRYSGPPIARYPL